ncbi:MAG TPA: transketolase [Azospirillaceae bacterium]|nr:transketolase [Azospirillaceae bacterium]HRQ79767.1 transketolase [Azospirillaceae bacterium]
MTATAASAADLSIMANAIRALAMDGVEAAKSGHPGMPMGMADAATALFSGFVKVDPKNPRWPNRDRFVLSAGHGSMLIYALSHLLGYEGLPIDELKRFRQIGSRTPGHPEVDHDIGVEMTTGPLGQGVSTAVGFALAERLLNARFGEALVSHDTYVIASDGDLQEGVSHEACALAGHLKLGRLIVLWDDNHISIDGPTELSFTEDVKARFAAYGWDVSAVDGHDPAAVAAAIEAARAVADKPSLIACRTIIGKGSPNKANSHGVHGSPLGGDEIKATREAIGWPHAPFEIPADILAAWRAVGEKNAGAYAAWKAAYDAAAPEVRAEFDAAFAGDLPADLAAKLQAFKEKIVADKPSWATRVASGNTLEVLVPAIPQLVGGSADLTPSNNTKTKDQPDVKPGDYAGRYIRYGIREHGMAAIMNGMTLHGGVIPYAGTFMQFADYSRPAIRLAALMKQRVVHVLTHDSIGLGEDGPTHQPVEHLAALRAIPNLLVFRPADALETVEAWELALANKTGPSALALTRQNVPTLRADVKENLTAKGAYVLLEATGKRKVTLFASGSEVSLAVEARAVLEKDGIGTAVVSMPCWELFEAQSDDYRDAVLGRKTVRVGIEAAARLGWDRWLGKKGVFIGMLGFGESAPYQELYKHFGITVDAVVKAAKERL